MNENQTTIHRLGLTKLYLWTEADRIQTYPQALARLLDFPELQNGATRRQIGEKLFRLAYVKGQKPMRENVLTNCFGLVQVARDKLVVRGINLFSRVEQAQSYSTDQKGPPRWETQDDLWRSTEDALAIGRDYQQDPNGIGWQNRLAEQIGRYEVRIRLLFYLLRDHGRLKFEDEEFFSGVNNQATLVYKTEGIKIFDRDGLTFNSLLFEHIQFALGPWWLSEIQRQGYLLDQEYKLEGATSSPPSTNKLSYNIRNGLALFKQLGILAYLGNGWGIDLAAASRHLSPELVANLTGETRPIFIEDEYQALTQALRELADESGFVIAAKLAERWAQLRGVPESEVESRFDKFLSSSLYEKRVQVLETHQGQPRMGRGLLGNDDQRRIRLLIRSD